MSSKNIYIHHRLSTQNHEWLKLIDIGRKFTYLESKKQGPTIFLSFEGDAILELAISSISKKDKVHRISDLLNWLHKKDKLMEENDVLESFET